MTGLRRSHPFLLVAAAAALATLPGEHFAPAWLALFALPGLLFLALLRGRRLPLPAAVVVAAVLQVFLCYAIHATPAAPSPQAALTYLLIAPLAFALARRRGTDVLHGLFLALCLLVIGSILGSGIPWAAAAVFALAGGCVLHAEAEPRPDARLRGGPPRGGRRRVIEQARVAGACVCAGAAVFVLLDLLPPPRGLADAARRTRKQVGLAPEFDLSSGGGGPLDLVDDELVQVTDERGGAAPDDLYLRCASFDVAGLDRWSSAPGRNEIVHDLAVRPWVRRPVAGVPVGALRIERLSACKGFVFVPPGVWGVAAVRGGTDLLTVPELVTFEEIRPRGPMTITVRYQELAPLAGGRQALAPVPGLRRLPPELRDRADLRALARSWAPDGGPPAAIARALARALRSRCDYSLEEPAGSSAHALDNFLFGSRSGYCMHFASALAILLRMRDVPCRIAVGLQGGFRGEDASTRIYGSRHAHAWVEVPLSGLGWVVFDATPPDALRAIRDREDAAARAGDGASGSSDGSWLHAMWPSPEQVRRLLPWLALLSLGALAFARPAPSRRRSGTPRPSPGVRSARRWLRRLLHALAKHGATRLPGEPLEAWLRRIDGSRFDAAAVAGAIEAYQQVRFGGRPFDAEREAAMRRALAAVTHAHAGSG